MLSGQTADKSAWLQGMNGLLRVRSDRSMSGLHKVVRLARFSLVSNHKLANLHFYLWSALKLVDSCGATLFIKYIANHVNSLR